MTTPALTWRVAQRRTTYARARLLLGISAVGTSVLLALTLLAFGLPARLLSNAPTQSVWLATASLSAVFVMLFVAFLLFDLIGGAWFVRTRSTPSVWLMRWARGAGVQLAAWTCSAALLMCGARAVAAVRGASAATEPTVDVWLVCTGIFVALQCALVALRWPIARLVASLPVVRTPAHLSDAARRVGLDPAQVQCVAASDEGFVGGWTGLLSRTLIVPERWASMPDVELDAALMRRLETRKSGAHTRGLIAAIAWNTTGFAIALVASGANPATAAGVLTIAACMTLWAFLGVLVLPTPSRRAVYAIDQSASKRSGAAAMRGAIERLDRWQDDEPVRSKGVETIFHPVPARSLRMERLGRPSAADGGIRIWHLHNVARHALWLNWGAMTPISRAVHCNVGRPSLWVLFPGD